MLNNTSAFLLNNETIYVLSHENLVCYEYLINKLEESYNTKVILSSTWRKSKTGLNELAKMSKKYKGLNFIDKTRKFYGVKRKDEIIDFCETYNISLDDILVIDDDSIDDNRIKQIKTFTHDGLRFSDVFNYFESEGGNCES